MKAKVATVTLKESHVKEISEAIRKLRKTQVLVGIAEKSKKNRRIDSPITNAQLGYIHEHGSPSAGIPARPFLRPGVKAGQDRIVGDLRLALEGAIHSDKKRVRHNLEAAGSHAVSEVKKYMSTADFEPLKPETIKNRRRSRQTKSKRASEVTGVQGKIRPLISTGALRDSVDYYVEDA